MLFYLLGNSFFPGIVVFMMAMTSHYITIRKFKKLNKLLMEKSDNRMNHTTEAITNIKALKLYSWTDTFEQEILKRRED